ALPLAQAGVPQLTHATRLTLIRGAGPPRPRRRADPMDRLVTTDRRPAAPTRAVSRCAGLGWPTVSSAARRARAPGGVAPLSPTRTVRPEFEPFSGCVKDSSI